MEANPSSLLVRITDFLESRTPALGILLGTASPNHAVMENLLYDSPSDSSRETYDLKPSSYFFPERDIADGILVPDSVIERLIDELPDQIKIHSDDFQRLLSSLEKDTELLSSHNVVDYSLFLVRYPPEFFSAAEGSWRTGVRSRDGKWIYRAVVLDFFWAKHKTQPRVMTGLINTFNIFAKKGPMSITAEPQEYRQRFLKMVKDYVELEAE